MLDDGRITDSQGRTVDFKNTVIILTSNLGSQYILEGIDEDTHEILPQAREQVNDLLKRSFRPEFLNRLDEIVFYKPLSEEDIAGIVDLLLADLKARLADKQLTLDVSVRAKNYIAENGYDPVYGARPLKRYLQNTLENILARYIIAGNCEAGDTLTVNVGKDGLTVEKKQTEAENK